MGDSFLTSSPSSERIQRLLFGGDYVRSACSSRRSMSNRAISAFQRGIGMPRHYCQCLALCTTAFLLYPARAATQGQLVSWGSIGISYVAPGTKFKAIGAGQNHSLAVTAGGTVAGWGVNYDGEVRIPSSLSNALAVAGGVFHSLALNSDGTLVA